MRKPAMSRPSQKKTVASTPRPSPQHWWSRSSLFSAKIRTWQVGPLEVTASHELREWRILSRLIADQPDEHWSVSEPYDSISTLANPMDAYQVVRHVIDALDAHIEVKPGLADRAVVSKPVHPLLIHPGEQVTVYVSSPLWFQLALSAKETLLLDTPIIRPSDTWFGTSTRHGELCYASKTNARLNHNEVPLSTIRATTPVELRNHSEQPLTVEKISLPVNYLSLYSDPGGRLWTEAVQVYCENQNEPSSVTIDREASELEERLTLLNTPRLEHRHGLAHSLNVLFG